MLGRKQSIKIGDTTLFEPTSGLHQIDPLSGNTINTNANPNIGLGPTGAFGAAYGSGATPTGAAIELAVAHQNAAAAGAIAWFNKTSVRHFMRICSVASLLSVCANTSRTFSWYPTLMLITFIVDIITGIVFTIEIVFKIYSRGLFKGPSPYARDRWCQFDATMVFFIWISILLQVSIRTSSLSSNTSHLAELIGSKRQETHTRIRNDNLLITVD